nr:MAG TPA: hypothetical protein [Caudoviricetes sp.]
MIFKFNYLEKYKIINIYYLYQLFYSSDDKLDEKYKISISNYYNKNICIMLIENYDPIFECSILDLKRNEVRISVGRKQSFDYIYHLYIVSYYYFVENLGV